MFKKYYHCFISGLPDLMFEDSKFSSTLLAFREYMEQELTTDDFALIELLFLPRDHHNLINFLQKKEFDPDPLGNFSLEDFEEQISRLNAILKQEPLLPGYLISFIEDFLDEEKDIPEEEFNNILMEGFYEHVLITGNPFLRQWFEFELNAKNILTAHLCRKFDKKMDQEIVGRNDLTMQLLKSRGRNIEIMTDDDYLNEMNRLAEEEDFYKRERKQDLLKWQYIDEHTFFYYFTVETIIGYLIKLFIVFRWKELDKETGREMFEKLIRDLQSSYELPEEFSMINR